MDQKIIDLQVKELSKPQYTKEQVLNELAHVMEFTLSKNEKQLVKNIKMDRSYRNLFISFCEFLEQDGRDVICYDKKLRQNHLMRKKGNNYNFYPNRMNHFLKINKGKMKSCRQKIQDRYDKFISEKDLDNLTEYEKGYLACIKSLMVSCKLKTEDELYPKQEEEIINA